jgi:hypothetical protein
MEVKGIKCPICKEFIISRANHDFIRCGCGNLYIDGGFYATKENFHSFSRVGFKDSTNIEVGSIELDISEKDLYNFWNKESNTFSVFDQKEQELYNYKFEKYLIAPEKFSLFQRIKKLFKGAKNG